MSVDYTRTLRQIATLAALLTPLAACGGTAPPMEPGPTQPATGPSLPGDTPAAPNGPTGPMGDPGDTPPPIASSTVPAPSTAVPAPAASESGVPAAMRGILASHNQYRARHCAPPMTWSAKVAAVAQRWANHLRDNNCSFDHSRGSGYGENLSYFAPVGSGSPQSVAKGWYDEVKLYDFGKPRFGMDTGHFTQMVWKGTTQLGCGMARCANAELWVCNYAPPGNVHGEFRDNVKPVGCTP